MYCIAFDLSEEDNKYLFQIAKELVTKGQFNIIQKFHFSIVTQDTYPDDTQINELKSLNLSNICLGSLCYLEGQNTDMDYLTLNLDISKENLLKIRKLRKKHMKESFFELIPHISLMQTAKTNSDNRLSLSSYIVENKQISLKNILIYGPDREIIKKESLINKK